MSGDELAPGAATEIYRLGYAAGQASTSTAAKLLKDEWWAGYAVGIVDAFGGEQPDSEAKVAKALGEFGSWSAGWIPTDAGNRQVPMVTISPCRPYGLRGRPMFGEHLGRKR